MSREFVFKVDFILKLSDIQNTSYSSWVFNSEKKNETIKKNVFSRRSSTPPVIYSSVEVNAILTKNKVLNA